MCVYVCVYFGTRRDNMKNGILLIQKIVADSIKRGVDEIPLELIHRQMLQEGFLTATIDRKIREYVGAYGGTITRGYLKLA